MTTAERLEKLLEMRSTAEGSLRDHAVGSTGVSQLATIGRVRDDVQRVAGDARGMHANELARELDTRAFRMAELGAQALLEQISLRTRANSHGSSPSCGLSKSMASGATLGRGSKCALLRPRL
jgi:hypothetical protein